MSVVSFKYANGPHGLQDLQGGKENDTLNCFYSEVISFTFAHSQVDRNNHIIF